MEPKQSAPNFFVLLILSFGFHFSIVTFVIIPFFLFQEYTTPDLGLILNNENRILYLVLSAAAVLMAMLSVFFPCFYKSAPETKTNTQQQYQDLCQSSRSLIWQDFSNITQRTFSIMIIRFAMAEAVALFGLVLALINQSPYVILPFAGLGLGLQIVFGPLAGKCLR